MLGPHRRGCTKTSSTLAYWGVPMGLTRSNITCLAVGFGEQLLTTRVSADPSVSARLGLFAASRDTLLDLCVAYSTYHAIKHSQLDTALTAIAQRDFRAIASVCISHAGIAARACGRV